MGKALAEYHISISYCKRTQNIVADVLFRQEDHVDAIYESDGEWDELWAGYKGDCDFGNIVKIKDSTCYNLPTHADKHFPEYQLRKEVLYKRDKICVPLRYCEYILSRNTWIVCC